MNACLTVRACRFCTCPIDFETVAGVLRKEDVTIKGPPTIFTVTYTLARGTGSVACKNNGLLCDYNDRKILLF